MNAQEISARLDKLTVEEMRKVWSAAIRELGTTTHMALTYHQHVGDAHHEGRGPRAVLSELLWVVNCEKRVYTKTGKKVLWVAHTSGGVNRMVDETTCSWDESTAALERCFAVAGK